MELNSYKLGDCLSMIENGVTIKQKEGAEGYPITRIETLSNDRFNRDRLGYANVYDIDNYTNHILDDEDLIMSHINSRPFLGRTVIYQKKDNEVIIHGMNVLRIKTNRAVLNPFYAYYYFKTPHFRKAIDNIRTDAINQSSINTNNIKDITIHVPSISDQESVVETLRAIDKKIELNENMNTELEAMAKQLYDYWFVQFDFPDENGKPYKSSGGKMVWNEKLKREIPEGWEVSTYGDVFDVKLGGTPSTTEKGFWENGTIHWLNSSEVQSFPVNDSEKKITKLAINNSSTEFLPKGSVLISITRYLRVTVLNIDACINQSVAGFAETDDYKYAYTYFSLSAEVPRLMTLRSGAQQPHINKETVENSPFLLPPLTVLEEYYKNANPLIGLLIKKSEETKKLTHLRDSLLPMLMNGQVTIE